MIVVLKKDISQQNLNRLLEKLRQYDCSYLLYENGEPILRIKTKQNVLTKDFFLSQPGVENVYRITPPYELATKKSADHETTIQTGDLQIKPHYFTIIAGPCAVESEEQILGIAQKLSTSGVHYLRGGAFKPRTSPYSFQGLGIDGLKLLRKAASQYRLKVVTEAVSSSDVEIVSEFAVAEKPESQELCFLQGETQGAFIQRHIPNLSLKGSLVNAEGAEVGAHNGIENFTIGQRRGLGIATGKPQYVVGIDAENRNVKLGVYDDLLMRGMNVSRVNWLGIQPPDEMFTGRVRIRYKHEESAASIYPDGSNCRVEFAEKQRAITPGQAAVFYDGDLLLGGGWIDSSF